MNTFKKGISISSNAWKSMNTLNITVDMLFNIIFSSPAVKQYNRNYHTRNKIQVILNDTSDFVINVRGRKKCLVN